jgi:hypothetical protein
MAKEFHVYIYVPYNGDLRLEVKPPENDAWSSFESAEAACFDIRDNVLDPSYFEGGQPRFDIVEVIRKTVTTFPPSP